MSSVVPDISVVQNKCFQCKTLPLIEVSKIQWNPGEEAQFFTHFIAALKAKNLVTP